MTAVASAKTLCGRWGWWRTGKSFRGQVDLSDYGHLIPVLNF